MKKIDNAWINRDYETLKSLISSDATLYHDDGRVSNGPEEFTKAIEDDYIKNTEEGKRMVLGYGFCFFY